MLPSIAKLTMLLVGVVVENFSYVFQTSTGGAKSITREEMRSFKKVWAEFANPKTRELERNRFVPFFAVSRDNSSEEIPQNVDCVPETQWSLRGSDISCGIYHSQDHGGVQTVLGG